jgi:hypothetical protein
MRTSDRCINHCIQIRPFLAIVRFTLANFF